MSPQTVEGFTKSSSAQQRLAMGAQRAVFDPMCLVQNGTIKNSNVPKYTQCSSRSAIRPEDSDRDTLEQCYDARYPMPKALMLTTPLKSGSRLACYNDDAICQSVLENGGFEGVLHSVGLAFAKQLRQRRELELLTYCKWKGVQDCNFGTDRSVKYVDVGLNVGTFAFSFWDNGYDVVGFEGMPTNVQFLSKSTCVASRRVRRPAHTGGVSPVIIAERSSGATFTIFYNSVSNVTGEQCAFEFCDLGGNPSDAAMKCGAQALTPIKGPCMRHFVGTTRLDSALIDGDFLRATYRLDQVAAIDNAASGRPVPTTRRPLPSDFFQNDFVGKIDVEGAELLVLEGAINWIQHAARPKALVVEVWHFNDFDRLMSIMGDAGYVVAPVQSDHRNVVNASAAPRVSKDHGFQNLWFVQRAYLDLWIAANPVEFS